jgi:hypothetical protein
MPETRPPVGSAYLTLCRPGASISVTSRVWRLSYATTKPMSTEAEPPQQWYVRTADGKRYGPLSFDALGDWIRQDRLHAGTQVLSCPVFAGNRVSPLLAILSGTQELTKKRSPAIPGFLSS